MCVIEVGTQFETLSDFGIFKHKRHTAEDLGRTPGTAVAANTYRLIRKWKNT